MRDMANSRTLVRKTMVIVICQTNLSFALLFVVASNSANKLVQYCFLLFCIRYILNNIPKIFDNF